MKEKVKEKSEFRGWMVPVWASRAISLTLNVILLMQITYYCTNALGLSAGLAGTILLMSKLFDGATDLVAGYLIDRTNTKIGKARPYELCIVGVWIASVLLFSTPDFGTTGKVIWVFALYSIINSIFATFLNASDAVYLARITKSTETQTKILSYSAPIGIIFATLTSIILPTLIAIYGGQPNGWRTISLFFAIPCGIIGLGRFFFLKEYDDKSNIKSDAVSLKAIFASLKNNKYVFIISMVMLLVQLATNISSAVGTYYFQYIYGDISAASIIGLVGLITPFSMFVMPVLMKKFSLKKVASLAMICGIVGSVVRLIGGTNMITLMIGALLSSMSVLPITMMINVFLIECMDYGQWKNGTRVEAAYSSINGLANKLGSGLASVAVGFVMQFAGFSGELETQSASANTSIIILFAVAPLVLGIFQLLVLKLYDLDKKIPQIRENLAQKG